MTTFTGRTGGAASVGLLPGDRVRIRYFGPWWRRWWLTLLHGRTRRVVSVADSTLTIEPDGWGGIKGARAPSLGDAIDTRPRR